jgi:hypothetical protein
MKKYYPLVRKLHLYFGLFISPLILVYSFSVLSFNHAGLINRLDPVRRLPDIKTILNKIPYDSADLVMAKAVCSKLGISGEVDFISRGKGIISFPVDNPGLKTWVRINTANDSVSVSREKEGLIRAMSYLHKMPGPHNESIRGNSVFIKVWRILTSMVVYLLLFLTVSGVFLWYFLKIERKPGVFFITLGIFLFAGLLIFIF